MVLQNAGDASDQGDHEQRDHAENMSEDEYPDVDYNDDRIPPSWCNEHGEAERRIILVGDAYDFFLSREDQPLPNGKTYEKDVRIDLVAEKKIDGDQGAKVALLLDEILNNYVKFCAADIKSGKDSGHRTIVVSSDSEGTVFIDYYNNDEVSRLTFNTYAVVFGQDPERLTEEQKLADPGREEREYEEIERRNVMKVAEADREKLFQMITFGSAGTADNFAESGRALPMMRFYAPENKRPSIERYGTFSGRENQGAHMQLVIDIDRDESVPGFDLDSFTVD
jgi:hypothetical protein